MKCDHEGLTFAVEERYKYVAASSDGTIIGWGFTKATLERQCPQATVYTIRQYVKSIKEWKGGDQ